MTITSAWQAVEHGNDPSPAGEAELLAAMERSDRDVAAGLIVPLADVLAALDDVAVRMDANAERPASRA